MKKRRGTSYSYYNYFDISNIGIVYYMYTLNYCRRIIINVKGHFVWDISDIF